MKICAQTGQCCEFIVLQYSPEELKRSYDAWNNSEKGKSVIVLSGIHLVYPMVAGRYRGEWKGQHIYGPCKHLNDVGPNFECSIWENRPLLCSGYPYYNSPRDMFLGPSNKKHNPGYMVGCGYNDDPLVGLDSNSFLIQITKPAIKQIIGPDPGWSKQCELEPETENEDGTI